jgi:two-component system, chemotaxis family, protein-glutamate methylesterase/glutaminase
MTDKLPLIKVMLVDDSPTVRAVLRRVLARTADVQVVGEANDGAQAVDQTLKLRPDVILMDVEMPVMDGYAATEQIMRLRPTPVLMVTSRANQDQVRTAFEAINRGALEVLAKPEDPSGWEALTQTLPHMIRSAVKARAGRLEPREAPTSAPAPAARPGVRYVAIGASTGGPQAVHELLSSLPLDPPAAILVVQHIATGFEEGLADWLAKDLGRDVQLAADNEPARVGTIRVAPGGAHLLLDAQGIMHLDPDGPARGGHRPSVDVLFSSCARSCPRQVAGVLLSGMGRDGAEGLAALRKAGGLTMVQDESSSVVFGMPRIALEQGAAEIALPPRELGRFLTRCWLGGSA